MEDALRIVGRYVEHYNQVRLHSAVGYIAPADKLAEARERRKTQRQTARIQAVA